MKYENLSTITAAKPAADDAFIVIADVRGSTAAIQEGRYRDVNLAGAACVAAMRNVFSPLRVPYVFGGDGASFLVGPGDLELALHILRGVQTLTQSTLGLNLVVGFMSMFDIRNRGEDVHFGFLSWSETEHLPFFRGHGVALAETEVKRQDPHASHPEFNQNTNANITGLSCRLMPFKAVRGRVLSILIDIVADLHEEDKILDEIFNVLKEDGPLLRLRPVSTENERRPWLSKSWRSEARIHAKGKGPLTHMKWQLKTVAESVFGTFLFRLDINNPIIGKPSEYTQVMLKQTDWIKMDGSLRLVLDLTQEEERKLIGKLDALSLDGKVLYGAHFSDSTIMTCHFQSPLGHEHAHFIDGADGGLSSAATQLKAKRSRMDMAKVKKIA